MSTRRSTRRGGVQPKKSQPNPSFYLGYVEDFETPEMIMKKFEALEQLQAERETMRREKESSSTPIERKEDSMLEQAGEVAGSGVNDGDRALKVEAEDVEARRDDAMNGEYLVGETSGLGFDDETYRELFKRTSMFSVRQLTTDVGRMIDEDLYDPTMDLPELAPDEEWVFEGDDDEAFFFGKRQKKRRVGGKKKSTRTPSEPKKKSLRPVLLRGGFVLRRSRAREHPASVEKIKIPDDAELGPSWCHWIAPYEEEKKQETKKGNEFIVQSRDVWKTVSQFIAKERTFEGVLVDFPWTDVMDPEASLRDLHLEELVPHGYIMMWMDKKTIPMVHRVFREIGFYYVENLAYVRVRSNNRMHSLGGEYLQTVHSSLHIFRKNTLETRKMQLRHQRNPDVVMAFQRTDKMGRDVKPECVCDFIETLLPAAAMRKKNEKAKLLALWTTDGFHRDSWMGVEESL
eukprot:TRINITY_DN836_c0_g1_i1.p1 TRINITY_DN836_c0_g1~~TRINITY_DN836_c0_g1_i1.p1  ORF type:complete len:459 (-),score=167.55 TRINITY_DN836_c0_g1_i1:1459-2835(-)